MHEMTNDMKREEFVDNWNESIERMCNRIVGTGVSFDDFQREGYTLGLIVAEKLYKVEPAFSLWVPLDEEDRFERIKFYKHMGCAIGIGDATDKFYLLTGEQLEKMDLEPTSEEDLDFIVEDQKDFIRRNVSKSWTPLADTWIENR